MQPITPDQLVDAAFAGKAAIVTRLLASGADINANGRVWNPLHAAIENMMVDTVRLLIQKGADLEVMNLGMRPLHHAIEVEIDAAAQCRAREKPDPVFTRMLLDAGADINAPAADGQTALAMAIEVRHTLAAELLRARNAR